MKDLKNFYKANSIAEASTVKLLYASSEHNADMRWLGGVSVPDPFIALVIGGDSLAVVNALEYGRVLREGRFSQVLAERPLKEALAKRLRKPLLQVNAADVIHSLLNERGLRSVEVAGDFPTGLTFSLRKKKVHVICAGEYGLFPQRMIKTADEQAAIRKGNAASAAGMRAAEALLREATIRKGRLYHGGKVLTSERVRYAIEVACLEKDAVSSHVIVAGGRQACDPHAVGSGPLRANELIIIDIFPRHRGSGYHGDMTRTFLRGKASESQRALVAAVRESQRAALKSLRAGVSGAAVHAAAAGVFEANGWETRATNNGYEGFIHSTGHGLGLEVHETPTLRPGSDEPLPVDAVVTVEPGLYYPHIGGARIEDVACIKEDGYQLLSRYHYRWEISG
jgi:Xaa-Pro aminopeptidase